MRIERPSRDGHSGASNPRKLEQRARSLRLQSPRLIFICHLNSKSDRPRRDELVRFFLMGLMGSRLIRSDRDTAGQNLSGRVLSFSEQRQNISGEKEQNVN